MAADELQHYIPKFWLKRFASAENDRVHVFDKHTDNSFAASPKKLAAQKNFYDFTFDKVELSLEPVLSQLESRAANHLAQIVKDGHLHLNNAQERIDLASFFAAQLVRTPAIEATWDECLSKMEAYLRRAGAPDGFFQNDPRLGYDENADRALQVKMIAQAPERLGPCLLEKDWFLEVTDREHPFLLGDHPLAMFKTTDPGAVGSLGVATPGVELHCPLTPRLAMAMYCPSHRRELIEATELRSGLPWQEVLKDEKLAERPWGPAMEFVKAIQFGVPLRLVPENVRHFNSLQVAQAERFVFSNANDFSIVREMIQTDERARRGHRLHEVTGKF